MYTINCGSFVLLGILGSRRLKEMSSIPVLVVRSPRPLKYTICQPTLSISRVPKEVNGHLSRVSYLWSLTLPIHKIQQKDSYILQMQPPSTLVPEKGIPNAPKPNPGAIRASLTTKVLGPCTNNNLALSATVFWPLNSTLVVGCSTLFSPCLKLYMSLANKWIGVETTWTAMTGKSWAQNAAVPGLIMGSPRASLAKKRARGLGRLKAAPIVSTSRASQRPWRVNGCIWSRNSMRIGI